MRVSVGVALVLLVAEVPAASAQPSRSPRAERLLSLGRAYLEAGDRGSAIAYFRDALRASPDHAEAYAALGAAYEGRGDYDEARRVFQAGLARRPDHVPLWAGLTRVLVALGSPAEAARAARELSRRDPGSVAAWRLRGDLARSRGAWNEALTCYRRIVQLGREGRAEEAVAAEAARYEAALRLLAGPVDPVSAPRACRGSHVRRALAGCRPGPASEAPP
ncbi:MAG: tetratricopeptide repeat protein [Sandaracinaceae bacterium]